MSKKQKKSHRKKDFSNDPFSNLKGFAVSAEAEQKNPPTVKPGIEQQNRAASFTETMQQLGVKPLNSDSLEDLEQGTEIEETASCEPETEAVSEEDQFLQAMGELKVRFPEQLPEPDGPPPASARRMKQLKQNKLIPEASLDLHGLQRAEVATKLRFFLQDAKAQGWQTLVVITGKGLHSVAGEPVIRNEAERYLAGEGRKWVAEWGRAPKKYGGAGAFMVFLRSK